MSNFSGPLSPTRRNFLATTGGVIAGAVAAPRGVSASVAQSDDSQTSTPRNRRKILIGVFDPAFPDLTLDQLVEKYQQMGVEAAEIGTGGYPNNKHCPLDDLLADPAKLRAWKKKFDDHNIQVATLSCHGNPVHPDKTIAERDDQTFRKTVLLAEKLDVKVIVGFSGCPGANPTDKNPNWITYRWPPEYAAAQDWQWKERVVPYWKDAAKYARSHGIRRIALEMHPNFMVYNPLTLLKLRDAVGEEIGANNDLSHLFWQGCNPVEVIHMLGKQGAIFHAHMKDTVLFPDKVARYGVLNFIFEKQDLKTASDAFRAVGYGHSASTWKDIMRAYMEVGYDGIFSVENEDPILSGEVGVERALYVLKNVREELLTEPQLA
ncbi:MAG: Inosose isomerase [Acidobacteriaceae bacterium]|nr:Inosose isomerase [Acidobacteriaceae bacterium]